MFESNSFSPMLEILFYLHIIKVSEIIMRHLKLNNNSILFIVFFLLSYKSLQNMFQFS